MGGVCPQGATRPVGTCLTANGRPSAPRARASLLASKATQKMPKAPTWSKTAAKERIVEAHETKTVAVLKEMIGDLVEAEEELRRQEIVR